MMMHNQFDSVRFNDYAHNNQGQAGRETARGEGADEVAKN